MAAPANNRAMGLIAVILFLDMAGVGLVLPVSPALVQELSGENLQNAALIGGAVAFTYSLMLFVCAPVIGGLSDRFGRRPVLLITLTAMGLDYLLTAIAPNLFWLFLGRAIGGVMGATWAAANSTVADLFPPEERAAKFGLLGGAGAAGFVLGPAIGGVLGELGPRIPFAAAGVLALAAAAAGWFLLIEPLPPERRRAFDWRRANPLGTVLQMRRIPLVIGVLTALLLFNLGSQSTMTIWAFSLIERFQWTPLAIGISVAVYGVMLAMVQGALTGRVIARWGYRTTVMAGGIAGAVSFVLIGIAPNPAVLYAAILIGAFGGLAFPAMQGMMSARVSEDAQGELQGAVAGMISISALAGPIIMPPVFSAFSDDSGLYLPGAPFLLGGLLTLAGSVVFLNTARRHGQED